MSEYLRARENYSSREVDQAHDCALWRCERRGEHPWFQIGMRLPGPVDVVTALEDAAEAAITDTAREWGLDWFSLTGIATRAKPDA